MIELFHYDFFLNALLASLLGGIVCGVVGVWIIMLRIPFLGVAMSHAALAGMVFGLAAGFSPPLCGLVFCLLSSAVIGPLAERSDLEAGTVTGIIFSLMIGLAFIGISLIKDSRNEALQLMWGNILFLKSSDNAYLFMLLLLILSVQVLFSKEIASILFNRDLAKASGVAERSVFLLLIVLTGFAFTLNLKSIGGLLVYSLVLNPPAAAYQLTYSMTRMYVLSAAFAVASSVIGLFCAHAFDLPAGAVTVIVSTVIFMLCLGFSPKKRERGGL